ncbi:MAG TPA: C4-type zinc ribbon domain-containing protein [Geobacteraceae bacterium]
MQKNLKVLTELQEIDLKADGLRGEKEVVLGEIAALEQKLNEAAEAVAAKNAELETVQAEKDDVEANLATEVDNIVRSEARLKEIKTQKEYQAVSKEITSAKKLKQELEEQALQKLARADEIKGEIAAMEADLKALEENSAARKADLDARVGELDAAIATDNAAREAAVKSLPASVMKRYNTLRVQRRGIAVVEARDGSCLGCNMQLPPQLYNSLFRGDDLITCPHCQRVLVLKIEAQG